MKKYGGLKVRSKGQIVKTLTITPELHMIIKDFAIRNRLTIYEAAYNLVTRGIIEYENYRTDDTTSYLIAKEISRQLKERLGDK